MYVPDIPSVKTSVIDRSKVVVKSASKRTILLPYFAK